MKIESVTIRGFRCFDDAGQTINLDDLTCFVGPNASGKTAAMIALARLFSESANQRQVVPSDFHLAPGKELNAKSPRILSIECRLTFPELEEGEATNAAGVPETFNQMIVDEPGGTPYCRIRLEATWTNDGTPTGDIEQSVSWILTSSDDPEVIEDGHRCKVQSGDRAKVRVVYVPASRDPGQQIRATTATSFGRLLNALAWDGADETLKGLLEGLQSQLAELPGVRTMNTQVQNAWNGFYDGRVAHELAFRALEEDPAALVRLLVPTFRPGEDGRVLMASDLSDGLRALFSLSLPLGLFRVEGLLRTAAETSGFKADAGEGLPILTVFAVEEPENHLSPQYLGRVVGELNGISSNERAQVLLSSHSPSILRRVQPDHVRYFLGNEQTHASRVKSIPLPTDTTDESFKYVREAVRGFPELYFAHLVILGEGASEEIVLQRLFEASGTPLDKHFISVVPLGGRHVNHFWRLLHGLEIQYLTLLDLDQEKEGAGWGRVQYVRDQLVKLYRPGHQDLRFQVKNDDTRSLDEGEFDRLHERPVTDIKAMAAWLSYFMESFDVFFSSPLDLDFCMLEAFPTAYKGLAPPPKGPRLPAPGAKNYKEAVIDRMKQVLAADVTGALADLGSTYTEPQQELFPWYKYLFVDGSKPVAHMRALLSIDNESLAADAPEVLKKLANRARELVTPAEGVD
jgi:putative ATP-dependent endonuclease of the OLD family